MLDLTVVVESKSKDLDTDTWYRVEVSYNFEDIEVKIQTENIREKKVLFKRKVEGLHRGSCGFATNGNIYFNYKETTYFTLAE